MDRISSTLLVQKYEVFVLDAYGVFWSGSALFEPAKDFMAELLRSGKKVFILSNATQGAEEEKRKYASFGLLEKVHYDALFTSGEIAKQIADRGEAPFEKNWRAYLSWWPDHPKFGNPQKNIFRNIYKEVAESSQADFIYLNAPYFQGEDQTDIALFHREIEAIAACRLPVICINPDAYVPEGNSGRFIVRQGAIADLLERKDVDLRYIGKPESLAFAYLLEKSGSHSDLSKIVMIGDNPKTDILGAKRVGLATVLLTETGVLRHLYKYATDRELFLFLPEEERPDFLLGALG